MASCHLGFGWSGQLKWACQRFLRAALLNHPTEKVSSLLQLHNKMSHLFLLINVGHWADSTSEPTCEHSTHTRIHAQAHTHFFPPSHTLYPSLLPPLSPLHTSNNSLSGFETWSAGCLVTAAWFSGYWSYPSPPHQPPSFYSVSQWTLFSPSSISAL